MVENIQNTKVEAKKAQLVPSSKKPASRKKLSKPRVRTHLKVTSKALPKKRLTQNEKQKIIKQYDKLVDRGTPVHEAAIKLGYHYLTMRNWKKEIGSPKSDTKVNTPRGKRSAKQKAKDVTKILILYSDGSSTEMTRTELTEHIMASII